MERKDFLYFVRVDKLPSLGNRTITFRRNQNAGRSRKSVSRAGSIRYRWSLSQPLDYRSLTLPTEPMHRKYRLFIHPGACVFARVFDVPVWVHLPCLLPHSLIASSAWANTPSRTSSSVCAVMRMVVAVGWGRGCKTKGGSTPPLL